MRILLRSLALAVVALAAMQPVARAADDSNARLEALFQSEWERGLRENPLSATYLGDHRYDDRWPDLSPAALAKSNAADRAVLGKLDGFDAASLTEANRLNRDLFRRVYQNSVDAYDWGLQYMQINQRGGVQTASEIAELIDFRTAKDYENWIARMNGIGTFVDQNIALLAEGAKRGIVQPRVIMQRIPDQIAKQVVAEPEQSPFWKPFETMPDDMPAAEQERLRTAGRKAITGTVVPAYQRLQAFFNDTYLPATQANVGIWALPDGDPWYQKRIAWFTTTNLTADQIHEIGLKEVARIRGEMQKVIEQVGFKGTFQEFLQYLRTDPKFHYTDPKQLLAAYQAMAKRIDPMLPLYFGRLPRLPYGVRPIPEQFAPDTTTAYYQGGAMDGTRAGYYYVNLYKPETRPTYEIPVLTIHEAVPGHHLQISLAQELGDVPMFRRDFEATAFVEGWALYSESLGQEMGFYDDPYDKFGQLTYEMWRAVRLVVDTGMHHKHWTREQAIQFFKDNAAKGERDVVNEIDRDSAWPGQAM